MSPPSKVGSSPPVTEMSPPNKIGSPPIKELSAPNKIGSPPIKELSPPNKIGSPPKKETSPPKQVLPAKQEVLSPPKKQIVLPRKEESPPPNVTSPPGKSVMSPPKSTFKLTRSDSKGSETNSILKSFKKETTVSPPVQDDKPADGEENVDNAENKNSIANNPEEGGDSAQADETSRVGDKIKKFEKAAEDASGRLSRPGSVRGRPRTDRLGSDGKEDSIPPATPFKDAVFDLNNAAPVEKSASIIERQQSFNKNVNNVAAKWQRNENTTEKVIKPEPQKIIKPEFKTMQSPVDATIRSPSLGNKAPEHFPSHGTAFRNVGSPDPAKINKELHKFNDDVNTQNNVKACKIKGDKKYSVSKGSSYFTRGSEEIWLVKKKDIEEIEERVLDSFRRAGGNVCMRSESMRPASDSGQAAAFTHATMGRTKRQMYSRSESLDPQWAGARAQTLKRQTSVACTCGHDKKTRAKSAGAPSEPNPARPRSRSHGDEAQQNQHVLDKYETLV